MAYEPNESSDDVDDDDSDLDGEAYELADLHPAYVWDCGHCGRENTQRAISQILDPRDEDDAEVIGEMYGEEVVSEMLGNIEDGNEPRRGVRAVSSPTHVVCRHCDRQYRASIGGLLPDDDDE